MTDLHDLLVDMVRDARPADGPSIRALAGEPRRRPRRAVAVVATVAATTAVVALATVVSRQSADRTPLAATFAWDQVSFHYPKGWYAEDFHIVSRGWVQLGPYVSTLPLSDPCTRPRPGVIECRSPIASLGDGDVLGRVMMQGSWEPRFARLDGTRRHRGDGSVEKVWVRPADKGCADKGGSTSVDVYVARDENSKRVAAFTACVAAAPGSALTRTVVRIGTSMRVTGDD